MLKKLMTLAVLTPLSAIAAEAPAAQTAQGPGYEMLFFGAVMVAMMYFMIWRPQSKKSKEHKALMGGITKGDEVSTVAGIVGKGTKVTDDYIAVEIASGVEMKFQKNAIVATLPKGTLKSI